MRYILDDNGYIDSVSCTPFNCKDKSCQEYTGTIPDGYETLEEWAINTNIRAYKIVDNNLVYDEERNAALEAEWELYKKGYVVLYNNLEGENISVVLSDAAENYEYLEIFYTLNDNTAKNRNKSMKHCMALGDVIVLDGQWCVNDGTIMQFQSAEYLIAGPRITQKHSRYVNSTGMGAPEQQSSIFIKRVLGYK